MRGFLILTTCFIIMASALPARASCICRSEISPQGMSADYDQWPRSAPPSPAAVSSVDLQLAGPNAVTNIDIMPGMIGDETTLVSGLLTLALTNAGPDVVLGSSPVLNAVADQATLPTCVLDQSTWAQSSPGGQVTFDFNNNTVSGIMYVRVFDPINQDFIQIHITGTIDQDPNASVALDVTCTYDGGLFLPTGCSVPATNLIGGSALAAAMAILGVIWLRRRAAAA
jgi:hypothetical protein